MRPFAPMLIASLQLLLVLGSVADTTSTTPTHTSPPWGTPTWNPVGCLVSNESDEPVLSDRITPDSGDSNLTGARCQELCFEHDWQVRFAGVEGGDACWCSQQVSKPQADDASDCNIPCSGDDSQLCGGDSIFFVYGAVYEDFWTKVLDLPETTETAVSTASTAPTETPTEIDSRLSGADAATYGGTAPSSTGDADNKAARSSLVIAPVVLVWACWSVVGAVGVGTLAVRSFPLSINNLPTSGKTGRTQARRLPDMVIAPSSLLASASRYQT